MKATTTKNEVLAQMLADARAAVPPRKGPAFEEWIVLNDAADKDRDAAGYQLVTAIETLAEPAAVDATLAHLQRSTHPIWIGIRWCE